MSLVDRFAGAVGLTSTQKSPATVADIEQKIADTQARVAQLQEKHARECLRWSDTGDAAERDRLADQLAAARVDLVSLESALSMSKRRNSQIERERLAGLNASRLHSCTIHLRAAEKAAAELSAALEKAARARRTLLAASTKARLSAPSPMPKGSLTEASTIDALISHELHRLSYDPGEPGKPSAGSLPGAKPPSLLVKDDPASITPLPDELKRAHDWAIGIIRGEISVERTPAIEAQMESEVAQLAAVEVAVSEPPGEFDPADLLPGTRSAAEIAATMPRVKLS